MALNWVMLNESEGRPLPLPNEHTILTVEKGADVILNIPDTNLPGGLKKLNALGKLWLTDQRLIFVAGPKPNKDLETLSVPLLAVLSTSFVQPIFGANYLTVDIKPSPGGGLSENTKAEIRLKDQPIIGFVSTLEKARERALYMKRDSAMGEDLPLYTSDTSAGPSATGTSAARQPDDQPPGYDMS